MSISSASAAGCMRSRSDASSRPQVGCKRVGADVGTLGLSPARTNRRVGLQVDLHLGVGRDDGADVTALDHCVPLLGELALAFSHDLAHLVVPRDDGNHAVDPRLTDHRGHVDVRR